VSSTKEKRRHEEKNVKKNNTKLKNEWAQKKAWQANHLDACSQMKGWEKNLPMQANDLRTKEVKRHKKNEQKEKTKTINLSTLKAFGIWPYTKWCWKCSLHSFEAPPNWHGHPKQLEYHKPLHWKPPPSSNNTLNYCGNKRTCCKIINIKHCSPIDKTCRTLQLTKYHLKAY